MAALIFFPAQLGHFNLLQSTPQSLIESVHGFISSSARAQPGHRFTAGARVPYIPLGAATGHGKMETNRKRRGAWGRARYPLVQGDSGVSTAFLK